MSILSILSSFSWFELWGPLWLILVIVTGYFYNKYIVKSHEYEVTSNQITLFYSGLVMFYLFVGSPFSVIAEHYLFSALMLQLSLVYFVIVPFIIIGLPFKLFKKYAWNHKLKLSMSIAGHPWLTLIVFNIGFSLYLLPDVFNFIHASVILSFVVKAFLFAYAFFMWWAIINPVRRLNELRPIVRIAYIFFASFLLFPIGFFFIVVLQSHYPVYEMTAGEIIPAMTAIYDQQLAGGLLKVIQLTSFIFAMYKILQNWFLKESEDGHPYDKNFRIVRGVVVHLDEKRK